MDDEYEHQKEPSENSTISSVATKILIEIIEHIALFFAICAILIITSYSLRYLIVNW